MANNSGLKKKLILNPPHLGPDEEKKRFRKNESFPFAIAVGETQPTIAILPTSVMYSTTAFISANWWWLNSHFVLFGKES
jgi:hypothetical protein